MNKTFDEALKLVSEVTNMVQDEVHSDVQVILAPPFVYLTAIKKMIEGNSSISLAAQNCSYKASGAYTGEVSAEMLKSVGVAYVILGHSERRMYFNETNQQLADKINLVLQQGMRPIFCGTGKTATSEQAQEMHQIIRNHIASKYGKDTAEKITILYGGSANPGNARELFSRPDVDGGLIGGASLKSRDFTDIIKSF